MKIFIALFLAVLCALQGGAAQAKPRLFTAPQSRGTWRSVRTNNLFVIGDADPEKLRQVAAWLEFFHSSFALLVSRNVLDASVPTTVIIFRDDASFQPFKPLYQGRTVNIAGFFQPGDDVNYIALSLDPTDKDPYSTAFHEYVHLHLKDNVPNAPLWLNEGLAELYGSLQFSGNDALLGAPLFQYIRLLREHELLPLTTLFSVGTNSPHYNEQEKSGIFYGESWALVHYLMLGERGRQEQFKRFLQQVSRGDAAEKAIQDSFGTSLPMLEQDLRSYVRHGEFASQRLSGIDPQAYASYTAMQRGSLSEGEANYYLGDLLLHLHRDSDAERYLKQAIALDPSFIPPYAALGRMYTYQRRYADAKKYLQKATSAPQSYLTHYLYAYVLSTEGMSSTGWIKDYTPENAALMRDNLLRSIKLAPDYAPAHALLAFVDLVREEHLDEAAEMAQKARQLEPSRKNHSLLLARIHIGRSDLTAARSVLEPLANDSDQAIRAEARDLLESLTQTKASNRSRASGTANVNSAMLPTPAPTTASRLVSGESSGVEINDGQTVQKSNSLPSVDELLAKYVEALGGAAALKAVTSRVTRGTMDVVGVSRGGKFEIYAQAPNKNLTTIEAHPFGVVKVGYNGRTGWTRSATGVRILKGQELARLQRDADFYGDLALKSNYSKITLAGMSKIGYREVYVLDLQPTAGALERLYLDAQTYLPVRVNTTEILGANSAQVEIYLDDWRAVDGVKYPFSRTQRYPKLTLTFTVQEIKHNVAIEANIFEP